MMPAKKAEDWLSVLIKTCARTSQSKVAVRLRQPDGFPSPTVINQVLKGKYPGRTDRLQAIVEGAYMNYTVDCSVLGTIPKDQCEQNQIREYGNTNHTRVRLYRACRQNCPHSRIPEES